MSSPDDEDNKALALPEYWDGRYAQSDGKNPTHEWFRSFRDLEPFLRKHLCASYEPARKPRILHLGAGDSTIPQGLTDHGYTDQICVDFSPVLVKLMDARKADGVTWLCADVRDMPIIGSSSIDVAFDKGTLDAMIHGSPWDPPDEVKANSRRYMQEVARVLKDSGVFLYITFRQAHFVKPLLNQDQLWEMNIETLGDEDSLGYQAFVLKKAANTSE